MIYIIFLIIFLFLFEHLYWKRRNLPPGPIPLPILGNTLALALNPPGYEPFLQWKKKFGSVYTFWFGNNPAVCLADYKIIKETIIDNSETFSARSTLDDLIQVVRGGHYGVVETSGPLWREQRRFMLHTFRDFGMETIIDNSETFSARSTLDDLIQVVRGGHYGVVETSGPLWREQRRFMLHTFRDFGMGKNMMQEKILDEVVFLIDTLKNSKDLESHNIQADVDRAVGSIINSLLFGYRYEKERIQEFFKLKQCLTNHMRFVMEPLTTIAMCQPLTIGKLPIFKSKLEKLLDNMNQLYNYFEKQMNEKKQQHKFDEDSEEPTNFCEAFLKEMHRQGGENEEKHSFSDNQLKNMCLDLWIAGLESTSNTVGFAILYYIRHPRTQYLVKKELDSVIDSDRLITVDDKNKLPYLNAFISETQRLANLLPINLIRKTTKDTTIDGHFIPQGSAVIPQISCVLYDEKIFPEPYSFKPERFVDSEGNLKKIEEHIPFSIGKRQCMGESLARMELFLLIANLFNQFEFFAEDGKNVPSLEKKFGFAVQPHPFHCQIRHRFSQ
uniref:Cytochrome P450 n=1 Tax=Panagrolaimus sp. JU765 TaxID=591449 RepID=A0AC34Q533_9BILA